MANSLERAFNKHFSKEFPEEVNFSDEDYEIDDDDIGKKRKRGKSARSADKSFGKRMKPGGKLFATVHTLKVVFTSWEGA